MLVPQYRYNYHTICCIPVVVLLVVCSSARAQSQSTFDIKLDAGAIVSLRRMNDAFPTEYIQNNRRLGDVSLRYRGKDGAWQSADTSRLATDGKVIVQSGSNDHKYKA